MTMFTRNDNKAPEPNARPATAPENSSHPTPEPVRAHAHVQTIAPATGTPSVSVISRALKITGQLESTENIQIDGEIDGDVRGASIKVGNHARVKGSVYGEEVELSGTVDGKIEAKKVVLTSSARMSGDVIHQDLTIHSGAYIAGHCRPEFGKTEIRQAIPVKPKEVISHA